MAAVNRKWYDGMLATEDWWAVWLGLFMLFAGMLTIWGADVVGWSTKIGTWVWGDFSWGKALKIAGKGYKGMGPVWSLLTTYAVWSALTVTGAYFMKLNVKKFFLGWTVIFFLTWGTWIVSTEAHFKAAKTAQSITEPAVWGTDLYCTTKVNKCTKQLNKALKKLGVEGTPDATAVEEAVKMSKNAVRMSWGWQLGGGFGFILALAVGLIIGNFFKPLANFLKEAAKPEWYIKTAIVFLGIKIGLMSMKAASFTFELAIAGAAAAFVAYLLFWPVVYWFGRKFFNLRRDSSAVLASGISICGVSASIATAGAIRAKPILPITVSMLIVIFAMFELIILPTLYTAVAPNAPIVNGAAMGMTVKTDGADAAAGAILDELMRAKQMQTTGQEWEEGWILTAAIITKIWIDIFIGLWAFVLALIWVYKVERAPGHAAVGASEIWFRFPKFVIGYFIAWFIYLVIAMGFPESIKAASAGANIVQSPMRKMFFMLTFVSMGVITDFSKLKGMGRLALLYAIALFVFIAPVAYVVSWIFHRGLVPPLVSS